MNSKEFSCIEAPVPVIKDQVHLENCMKKCLAEQEMQNWKSPSYSKCGSGVKKMALEVVP